MRESVDLAELSETTDNAALHQLSRMVPTDGTKPFADWVDVSIRLLAAAGWTGHNSGSQQYQAHSRIVELLQSLRGATATQSCTGTTCLGCVRRICSRMKIGTS